VVFLVVLAVSYSEEQIAAAHEQAAVDIAWADERVQRLAAGLRRYVAFGLQDTRPEKVATLCSVLSETFNTAQQNLLLGVAIMMIAESELELTVVEDEGFVALTTEVEKYLRAAGRIT
jgi:hypothetical protein